MRTVLFSLLLCGCHPGYLSNDVSYKAGVAEYATGIKCDLSSPYHSHAELTQAALAYLQQGRDAGVLLVFYENSNHESCDLSLIEVGCDCFHFSLSENGNTSFLINLSGTAVNPSVSDYFLEDGSQALVVGEEIWLTFWALDEGELKTYEILVSESGNMDNTGLCTLLFKQKTTP
jgi:hypothetical protein